VQKILIAEDDLVMADMLEELLLNHGYEVCGIARTVDEAVALGRVHEPDLALIDFRLADGGLGTDIPAQLSPSSKTGVLYATGNGSRLILTATNGEACLAKPYRPEDLLRSLEIVAEIVATGTASPPFPHGFQLLKPVIRPEPRQPDSGPLEVRRLLRQQAALAGFGSFALRQTDLKAVLDEASRACAKGLRVPFAKVCRYRTTENDLLIESGFGWKAGVIGTTERADLTSPQGRAFVTGQPSIYNDLRVKNDFDLPAFYADHGILSIVDVVIRGKDDEQPLGVLEVDNSVQHDYDQHDINFLTGFANVVAEAVGTWERTSVLRATIEQMGRLVEEKDQLLARHVLLLREKELLAVEKDLLLDQKDVMAEELQHRVRNNLQLIHGMLSKQLEDTTDLGGRRGLKAIAGRVSTLAQVFNHLLGTEMTRTTNFGTYLQSLCLDLAEIQAAPDGTVTLTCNSDPIILDLDVVTALGLVVAELVANGYDHAFPDGKGVIKVSVHHATTAGRGILTISDNGPGFRPQVESKRHGLGLVRRLVEQIRGALTMSSDHGTVWIVNFPVPPAH